jgi:hypothetical protein
MFIETCGLIDGLAVLLFCAAASIVVNSAFMDYSPEVSGA